MNYLGEPIKAFDHFSVVNHWERYAFIRGMYTAEHTICTVKRATIWQINNYISLLNKIRHPEYDR